MTSPTGRVKSSSPNIQSVIKKTPEVVMLRKVMEEELQTRIVESDYHKIEMRIYNSSLWSKDG